MLLGVGCGECAVLWCSEIAGKPAAVVVGGCSGLRTRGKMDFLGPIREGGRVVLIGYSWFVVAMVVSGYRKNVFSVGKAQYYGNTRRADGG